MMNEFDTANLINISIVLLIFVLGMLRFGRSRLASSFKMLLWWAVIILVVTAAYSYWPDFKKTGLYVSLVPGAVITNSEGEIELRKANDGHFYMDTTVNGANIRFMIDTGASDIVLSRDDAIKAGIDVSTLEYNRFYSTANGTTRGASVKISYLEAGEFRIDDFYASVNEGQLDNSLLGMTFLSKFSSYRVEGDRLLLKR